MPVLPSTKVVIFSETKLERLVSLARVVNITRIIAIAIPFYFLCFNKRAEEINQSFSDRKQGMLGQSGVITPSVHIILM
jgi:hypothetical protein